MMMSAGSQGSAGAGVAAAQGGAGGGGAELPGALQNVASGIATALSEKWAMARMEPWTEAFLGTRETVPFAFPSSLDGAMKRAEINLPRFMMNYLCVGAGTALLMLITSPIALILTVFVLGGWFKGREMAVRFLADRREPLVVFGTTMEPKHATLAVSAVSLLVSVFVLEHVLIYTIGISAILVLGHASTRLTNNLPTTAAVATPYEGGPDDGLEAGSMSGGKRHFDT